MSVRSSRSTGGHSIQRLEINYDGIGELLNSEGVRKDLKERAERVAAVARQSPYTAGIPVVVDEGDVGRGNRAHVWIKLDHPAGLRIEALYRVLGQSIDAAGD